MLVKNCVKKAAIVGIAAVAGMSLFACSSSTKKEVTRIENVDPYKQESVDMGDSIVNKEIEETIKGSNNENNGKDPNKYDKNGNPYLSKDKDYKDPLSYTFKNNGMREPIEAPPKGKTVTIKNPNTGVKCVYNGEDPWHKSTHDQAQAEVDEMQNRVMGGEGNLTEEQAKEIVKNMTINMGGMQ